MKAFKTVSAIQKATEEELIKVVGKARARVIRTYFS
jgi:DNA integrity scanning protein DisA with diadenylate cyclase activity